MGELPSPIPDLIALAWIVGAILFALCVAGGILAFCVLVPIDAVLRALGHKGFLPGGPPAPEVVPPRPAPVDEEVIRTTFVGMRRTITLRDGSPMTGYWCDKRLRYMTSAEEY